MQVPVLNGIYTDRNSDFRTSYPRNLVPVPKKQGISEGYLRPAEGIVQVGTGPGNDRGGINWNGVHYRVMGTSLIKIDEDGGYTSLGFIPGTAPVTFDYSFTQLAIAADSKLYYWDNTVLTQVTDVDIGSVVDMVWVDGYFMTTDGQYLIVTELNNPLAVNPLKYGSAEADPDPIKGLLKLRNEIYALNRYTIEVFQNVGGDLFPFERIEGAQMIRGAVGTHCAAVLMESLIFMGSGRNEAIAIWVGSNGSTVKVSTREIDQILTSYTEEELSATILETRVLDGHQFLYVHLPDRALVYDASASQIVGEPVWFTLTSSLVGNATYRARNFVHCYNRWYCGDPTSMSYGYLDNSISSHYGEVIGWDFGTAILYNEGRGLIFYELELVCLTGRVNMNANPTIWTSYSVDGENWSQERPRSAGMVGQSTKRINWLQQGHMRHWRCQRFRGTSDSHLTISRLEVRVEGLNV